ncbi:MetS family NSS transporter small subunit [Reichenbachiella ulvae]|uniref:MetS family NSS transporter small subunit n=1 Tax=Reichenbachiella ulvae TaxID=2980104 RepID=A0ABT3CSM6_9BACT|nr:MetS family NSS transporter small subunit [Reichenbachiella ulvae]MCV9386475.1 MetS family NSS transporter small subunit [Reichenbachiella ulvae]
MSLQAIISMIVILGVVVGGFVFSLAIAIRKEKENR